MVSTENGIIKPIEPIKELSFVRADELNSMDLEKPFFVVEKILPIGLCVFAAPFKYGKSWFSLDLCISVSTGTKFLGFKTAKADVLYLALEDSNSRLQERMRKVLNGREPPKGLGMSIHAGTLQHGLMEQLTQYITGNPQTKLIVIDTFQMIRDGGKRGESAYSVDYRDCGQLKAFADNAKICLLLVHHMRKMRDASDTFMNISGTAGISGAADTIITMSRDERNSENTLLSLTGRDIEPQDYQIQFNKDTYRWNILGTAEEVEEMQAVAEYDSNPLILTIRKLLEQNQDGWVGSASEIINASRMFKTPIYDKPQKLGRSIEGYQDMLFQHDNILYEAVKNGTGAKKHRFYYGFNPFTQMTIDTVDNR